MSASGLDVFDRTLETTHIWLNEICNDIGPDKQVAWKVLSTVLHKLRDRLTVNLAAHLGAQLPLLVRGLYYDQWRPASGMRKDRRQDEFLAHVAEGLRNTRPVNTRDATRAVFAVMERHVTRGQIEKVISSLPHDIRSLWPAEAAPAAQPTTPASGNDMLAEINEAVSTED